MRVVATDDGKPAGADIPLPGDLVDSCVCADNLAVAAVWSRHAEGQSASGTWGRHAPVRADDAPRVTASPSPRDQGAVNSP